MQETDKHPERFWEKRKSVFDDLSNIEDLKGILEPVRDLENKLLVYKQVSTIARQKMVKSSLGSSIEALPDTADIEIMVTTHNLRVGEENKKNPLKISRAVRTLRAYAEAVVGGGEKAVEPEVTPRAELLRKAGVRDIGLGFLNIEGIEVPKAGNTEKHQHLLFKDLQNFINAIITVDYGSDSEQTELKNTADTYVNLLRLYSERVGNEAISGIADFIEALGQSYALGGFDKRTLNFDSGKVRWEVVEVKFKSENVHRAYDAIRTTGVWQKAVGKLSDLSYVLMLDGDSPWDAGDSWATTDRNREIYEFAHSCLYFGFKVVSRTVEGKVKKKWVPFTSDEERAREVVGRGRTDAIYVQDPNLDYRSFIDQFPAEGRFNKKEVIGFVQECAWFDSSYNNFRGKAELPNLGCRKRAIKSPGGEMGGFDAVAAMYNGGYNNKNLDQGFWATFFGAIAEVPTNIANGSFKLSDYVDWIAPGSPLDKEFFAGAEFQRDKHAALFKTYVEMVDAYYQWRFGFKLSKFIDKWRPIKGEVIFPTLDAFTRAPLMDGKRNSRNNWNAFYQARQATLWLIENTAGAYGKQIPWTGIRSTDRQQMIKLGKDLGSELAKAMGWRWSYEYQFHEVFLDESGHPIPNDPRNDPRAVRREEDQKKFFKTMIRFYLIRVIDSMPFDDLLRNINKWDEFKSSCIEYLETFSEAVIKEYVEGNTSFNIWGGILRETYLEVVNSSEFKDRLKKVKIHPKDGRAAFNRVKAVLLEGKSYSASLDAKDADEMPRFPFTKIEGSDRSPTVEKKQN